VDCSGSVLSNPIKAFAIPQEPEAGDVIINEVLFNSWLDDGEFVELYNKSDKVIDTRQLLFSKLSFNVLDTTYSSVQLSLGQLFPGEYLVITKNGTSLEEEYVVPNPDRVYVNADFPLLTNSEGDLLLSKTNQRSFVIDAFHYNENMHHPLLTSVRGVSLERLSPSETSNNPNNWQSAASNVNFGTPTYQNSQFQAQTISEDQFQISPEVFSPDIDGKDDILQINYQFAQDGYTLNVKIFNASGQQIRYLVKNEWMGTEGQLFWDGTMDSGEKAAMGIYILYFEYFDLDGKVESLKKTCVLGGML
ncbi:MAG: gliding motility-associated C-terminal domain-containing protein, partial [Bacteroidales bacterium]|nr:gliding motility-associated C-terminal domain-containing protein [Bacteroidales bacterium]